MKRRNRGSEQGEAKNSPCRRRMGVRGEEVAAAYLRRKGFRIVEVNARSRLGEIDLVAMEGETVVIVEVKSKGGRSHGSPEDMLTAAKQRRLTLLARVYLQRRRWLARPARFDVVAIDWEGSGGERIRYYRDAFPASERW
jgi:putative endonuclease